MALIVSDANIFIDMEIGGLTRLMFRIGEEIAVPDVLYAEELREHHGDLPGYGLRVLELWPEFVAEAARLRGIYRDPCTNDLLALALAKQETCPFLTGDNALRGTRSERNGAVTVGTLRVTDVGTASRGKVLHMRPPGSQTHVLSLWLAYSSTRDFRNLLPRWSIWDWRAQGVIISRPAGKPPNRDDPGGDRDNT